MISRTYLHKNNTPHRAHEELMFRELLWGVFIVYLTALRFFCSMQIAVMPATDTISRSHHSHR